MEENGRDSLSDESVPEDIEPKLLRRQLLEVSGKFRASAGFSFCFLEFVTAAGEFVHIEQVWMIGCVGGAVVRALDFQSSGHGFISQPGRSQVT